MCRCWWVKLAATWGQRTRHTSGLSLVWLRMQWWLCKSKFVLSHRRLPTAPARQGWKNLVVAGFYNLGHQMLLPQSWGRGVKTQSLKTGLYFPYSQFPPGEAVSDTYRRLPPFSFSRLNECVCIWVVLAMLSQVFPMIQSLAITPWVQCSNPGQTLPMGSALVVVAGSLKMVTKPVIIMEKVFISLSSPGRLNRALTFLCIPES